MEAQWTLSKVRAPGLCTCQLDSYSEQSFPIWRKHLGPDLLISQIKSLKCVQFDIILWLIYNRSFCKWHHFQKGEENNDVLIKFGCLGEPNISGTTKYYVYMNEK